MILIVAEEPIEREAVARLVREAAPAAQVHAVATVAEVAAWIARRGAPKLGLLGVAALAAPAAAALQGWRSQHPAMRLALYASPDAETARRALAAGFEAVIARTAEPSEFVSALRFVIAGNRYLSPAFLAPAAGPDAHGAPPAMLDATERMAAAGPRGPGAAGDVALTRRQRQVLELLARGEPNKHIGARLGIAEATVKLHVHRIMRALGVRNRTAAALLARGRER